MSEPDSAPLMTVDEAIAVLDGAAVEPRTIERSLAECNGLVLAQWVRADRDYPPFDKSQMDGFAVRAADVRDPPVELAVVGEIPAGTAPARGIGAGEAMAIMTGAPLPAGADAVIPVEDSQPAGAGRVRLLRAASPGRYIARRGAEVTAGQVVLERGMTLGPAGLAVAAGVGTGRLSVYASPRVGVLATGDELVAASDSPGSAQIRNSNSPMLIALLQRLGCDVSGLGVVRDDPRRIRDAIADALMRFDVLFVTGGMSMGTHDHVQRTLIELGVEPRITKLRIKPGKPFVFGVKEGSGFGVQGSAGETGAGVRGGPAADLMGAGPSRPGDSSPPTANRQPPATLSTGHSPLATSCRYVFGLPGNPVSGFVCTLRLASRLIARLRGANPEPRWLSGPLLDPLESNGGREFYQPAIMEPDGSVRPLQWKGSADVFALARATGLLVRPAHDPARPAGSIVRVLEIPT